MLQYNLFSHSKFGNLFQKYVSHRDIAFIRDNKKKDKETFTFL